MAAATGAEDLTKEHGVRVARLAGLVAQEFGVRSEMQQAIEAGCLVHDVGKVGVPSSVVLKSTKLEEGEQQLYDAHPSAGAEPIERMALSQLSVAQEWARYHHHRYDGDSASPLRGEAIPLEARIASVCDRYDGLVTGRPCRLANSNNDTLQEIFERRSQDFDPKIVDIFIEVIRGLQREHSRLQSYLSEEADGIEYFATQRMLKKAASRAMKFG